jgi:hypothetical protein
MRHRGFSETAIRGALLAENAEKCIPPLAEAEVASVARSIARYEPQPKATWPEALASEAFQGLAGEFVALVEPHSEADPAGLLVQFLVGVGNTTGARPHFTVESDIHHTNLFAVLVGATAKGRKGSSWGHVRRVLATVSPEWAGARIQSGLSSGEGLIWAVRDPIEKLERVKDKGQPKDFELVTVDQGVEDKRLLVLETELASTFQVLKRDGNNLSAIMRQAWDSGDLRTLTKNNPAVATGAHISVIGHITAEEVKRHLDRTEIANGFANRFLWVCVKRSKCLPEGGQIQSVDFASFSERLNNALSLSARPSAVARDSEGRKIWAEVYPELSEGSPGLLGAVTSRAEAQVMRLSIVYALLDCSQVVRKEHLRAALAVWDYCLASCRFLFGTALGDPVTDDLCVMLRRRPEGMSRTEIRDAFGRHRRREEIDRSLSKLSELGLARSVSEATDGRSKERWFPVQATEATKATKG